MTTEAVMHAHRRGVVHRDLKPENVLFRSVEDGWAVPKVADWGLAKLLLDHTQSVEGFSPRYAAPEQLDEDHGETGHRTDVYQLGAVLYELFTGEPAFEGPTTRVVTKVLSEPATPPSEVAPELPPAIDDVLLTALAKDRDDRQEDVIYLRDALRAIYEEP
jgi:serine/threonine protein kinase